MVLGLLEADLDSHANSLMLYRPNAELLNAILIWYLDPPTVRLQVAPIVYTPVSRQLNGEKCSLYPGNLLDPSYSLALR